MKRIILSLFLSLGILAGSSCATISNEELTAEEKVLYTQIALQAAYTAYDIYVTEMERREASGEARDIRRQEQMERNILTLERLLGSLVSE